MSRSSPTSRPSTLARCALAASLALAALAPRAAVSQSLLPPPPGPRVVAQQFPYSGCDASGATLRSCTLLVVDYLYFWNPFRNAYEGGPRNRGTTLYFTPGTIDCLRTGVPQGDVRNCPPVIQGNGTFQAGSVGFDIGGCSLDGCLFFGGVPDPASMSPTQITFAVAYGPAGVFYDPRTEPALPGVTRASYVLTRATTTVPEPSLVALTTSGLLALGVVAHRRRRRAA